MCIDQPEHIVSRYYDFRRSLEFFSLNIQPSQVNYEKYRDHFLLSFKDVVKKTFDAMTQFAQSGWITGNTNDTHKSPFPALNVRRRNKPVAADTIFSNTPGVDDGSAC